MPLVSKTFNQLLDFTRTSAATFVGSDGLIRTTAASRNLLTFTQEFDNAAWSKTNTTVTANSAVAPDGTSTADTLTAGAGAGAGQQTYQTLSNLGSGVYVYSIYAKQGSGATDSNSFSVRNQTTSTSPAVITFNYETGVITQTAGSGATAVSVGNGWWRLSIPFTLTATVGDAIRFYAGSNGAVETPNEFFYAWGAQLEAVPDGNLTLGSTVVTNGDFATDTVWSKDAGWTISGGTANFTDPGSGNRNVSQAAVTVGKTYAVTYTITSITAGTFRPFIGGAGGTSRSSAGTYTDIIGPAADTIALIKAGAGTTGAIDNVSIREVTGTVGMPSTYTRNVGGVFPPRFDYDPVTLAPKGLLVEEQRTNLILRSEEFDNASWGRSGMTATANATAAPDGTITADALTASVADPTITQTFTVSAGANTVSIYVKGSANTIGKTARVWIWFAGTATGPNTPVSVTLTANWQRIIAPVTATGGGSVLFRLDTPGNFTAGDMFYAWGAQAEAGAFATSYIPTVASQVTRTADRCDIVAPNFAPWYNQSQGTFVAEFSGNGSYAVVATDGTTNNYNGITYNSPTSVRGVTVAAGVFAGVTMTGGAAGTVTKTAYGYKVNDLAGSTNGGAVVANATAAIPTLNQLLIGTYGGFGQLNGHIRSIRYYPVRLSNSQLQALTA